MNLLVFLTNLDREICFEFCEQRALNDYLVENRRVYIAKMSNSLSGNGNAMGDFFFTLKLKAKASRNVEKSKKNERAVRESTKTYKRHKNTNGRGGGVVRDTLK